MKKLLQKVLLMTFISFSSNQLTAQWVQTNGPQGGEAKCLTSIDTILFVGTEFGVFRSTDNGASWISTGLKKNANVLSFAVKPSGNSGMNLFAGTAGGVYLSTDHGDSWK